MLILASKSPRRIDLLEEMGVSFISHPADVDENSLAIYPQFVPFILARAKAAAVAELYPENLVLGVDTIISIEGEIIGKPENLEHAKQILLSLSGREHKVISGVCLIRKADFINCVFIETSLVVFKKIDSDIIQKYFSLINPMDKAGAYAIQEHASMIVEKIEGSKNNIIGLPTEKLIKTLKIAQGKNRI